MAILDENNPRDRAIIEAAFANPNVPNPVPAPAWGSASNALLGFGAGMLNQGPSPVPISFGQQFGQGLLGAAEGMNKYQQQYQKDVEEAQKLQMQQMAMQQSQQKMAKEQAMLGFLQNRLGGSKPNVATGQAYSGQNASIPPTVGAQYGAGNQSAGFPITPQEMAMLDALGYPHTKTMLDLAKYQNDGSQIQAGSYRKDPTTGALTYMPKVDTGIQFDAQGRAIPIAGYPESNAAIKGQEVAASEKAKAGLDMVELKLGDGSTISVLRSDLPKYLAGQSGTGGNAPASLGQKPIGAPSTADTVYNTETAKDFAKQYTDINKAGFEAPAKIARYQQLGKLLEDHDGGKLSPTGLNIASYMNSIGLKVDKNLPNKEAAALLTNQLALELRNPSGGAGMPGSLSDSDREFLLSSTPGLAQSSQGRKQMIDMAVALQKRNQEVAEMARKWNSRYGRLDKGNPVTGKNFFSNLQEWSNRNRIFGQEQ